MFLTNENPVDFDVQVNLELIRRLRHTDKACNLDDFLFF